jgi:hypothetical protein
MIPAREHDSATSESLVALCWPWDREEDGRSPLFFLSLRFALGSCEQKGVLGCRRYLYPKIASETKGHLAEVAAELLLVAVIAAVAWYSGSCTSTAVQYKPPQTPAAI